MCGIRGRGFDGAASSFKGLGGLEKSTALHRIQTRAYNCAWLLGVVQIHPEAPWLKPRCPYRPDALEAIVSLEVLDLRGKYAPVRVGEFGGGVEHAPALDVARLQGENVHDLAD